MIDLSIMYVSGQDSCVELLLDREKRKEFVGNAFSPLHCAV